MANIVMIASMATTVIKMYIDGKILDEEIEQIKCGQKVMSTKIANKIEAYKAQELLENKKADAILNKISDFFDNDEKIYKQDLKIANKMKHLYKICKDDEMKNIIKNKLNSHLNSMREKAEDLGVIKNVLSGEKIPNLLIYQK